MGKSVKGGMHHRNAEIGAVARVVDRAFDDPAMSGGLFVLTLTTMAIVSNAMFLQPVAHPTPMFSTRTAVVEPAAESPSGGLDAVIEAAVPLPRVRDGEGAAAAVLPTDVVTPAPVAPAQPVAAPVQAPPAPVVAVTPQVDPAKEQLAAVQRELARLGLYSGAIDGIEGPRTRAAVSRYQATSGLQVTGVADAALLNHLQFPPPAAATPEPPLPVGVTGEVTGATLPSAGDAIAKLERESAAIFAQERLSRVQAALNKIGYGPLTVDGRSGPSTVSAIQRFQLDNGLDITGGVAETLISRLIAIGAMDAN